MKQAKQIIVKKRKEKYARMQKEKCCIVKKITI